MECAQKHKVVESYAQLHARLRNRPDAKTLIYSCSGECGGLGDRLKGAVSTYLLGALTGRVALLDWREPTRAEEIFSPGAAYWKHGIDWRIHDAEIGTILSHAQKLWAIDTLPVSPPAEAADRCSALASKWEQIAGEDSPQHILLRINQHWESVVAHCLVAADLPVGPATARLDQSGWASWFEQLLALPQQALQGSVQQNKNEIDDLPQQLPVSDRMALLEAIRSGCHGGWAATGKTSMSELDSAPDVWAAMMHAMVVPGREVIELVRQMRVDGTTGGGRTGAGARMSRSLRQSDEAQPAMAVTAARGTQAGDSRCQLAGPTLGVHLRFGSEIDPLVGGRAERHVLRALPQSVRAAAGECGWQVPRWGAWEEDRGRSGGPGAALTTPSVFVAADSYSTAAHASRDIANATGLAACSLGLEGRQAGMYHVDRTEAARATHLREQRAMLAEWVLLASADALLTTGSGFVRTAAAAGFVRRVFEARHDGGVHGAGCPTTVRPQARPGGAPSGFKLPPY